VITDYVKKLRMIKSDYEIEKIDAVAKIAVDVVKST